VHERKIAREVRYELDGRTERPPQEIAHIVDQPRDIDRFGPQFLAAGESEQALGQGGTALCGAAGAIDQAARAVVAVEASSQHFEIAEDRHQEVVEVVRQAAGKLAEAVELLHLVHLRQRLLALRRALLDAALELGIRLGELGRALLHAALELGVEPLEVAGLAIELGEDADLGAQQLGHHRHGHVIRGAVLVALDAIEVGHRDCRYEDDRRALEPRMLADHRGELETVELRHADVDQHDTDVVLQQQHEGFARRVGLEEILVELGENDLVAQQLRRLIVDQQDVDLLGLCHDVRHLSDAATSAAPTTTARCSPVWRDSPRRRPRGISHGRLSSLSR
jgi:hypothetical protein